jgi:molybdate transport system substrate-binding protein
MAGALNVLCAGAVKGLVEALREPFAAATGASLRTLFGAVGALRDALGAGEPCDVLVVTEAMAAELEASGELMAGTRAAVGRVRTGVAVPAGAPRLDIDSAGALAATLGAASALYFPDAVRSTAGAHFVAVLDRLGARDRLAPRFRMFPNGATAMRALADSGDLRAVGCTQITEIRYTPGLDLVGALPPAFELATVYSAALTSRASDAALALRFVELLTGPGSRRLRAEGGFDGEAATGAFA